MKLFVTSFSHFFVSSDSKSNAGPVRVLRFSQLKFSVQLRRSGISVECLFSNVSADISVDIFRVCVNCVVRKPSIDQAVGGGQGRDGGTEERASIQSGAST
jgi:hypothetical protein